MKILCLNPPISIPASWGKPFLKQPLGLAYIAGVLQKNNEVTFLDANAEGFVKVKTVGDRHYYGLSKEEIIGRISKINPEFICMSMMFTVNSINALDVLGEIKKNFPKVITVVGGAHVTVRPEETLRNAAVDFIVLGEGEKTVEELFDCISKNGDLSKIKGVGFKNNGEIKINEARERIRNLDELPFPALDLLPMGLYFKASASNHLLPMGMWGQRKERDTYNDRWTSIVTSRGCPMNCIFCSIHLSMGKLFRSRSPENVISEIERDYEQFGIRHFCLEDDNMTCTSRFFIFDSWDHLCIIKEDPSSVSFYFYISVNMY